jgi:cytidyltransferase-like protein
MNGIIFGCFDILHYGHIRAIKYCIDNCDHLTIGLFTCKAIFNRATPQSGCECIQYKTDEGVEICYL